MFRERKADLIFGMLFGAWLGVMYALTTQVINWIYLPGIPLQAPGGNLAVYLWQYIGMGALLGIISALPTSRYTGMVLGGFFVALFFVTLNLINTWGTESFARALITLLYTFLPLVVLMLPLALIIRLCVDAQHIDPDRPHLWGRRILTPLLLTVVAVLVGSFSLHSPDARMGFVDMNKLLGEGMQAASPEALPAPLRDVRGFIENARGPYELSWSDKVETFMGPVPVGAELTNFLIIAHYPQKDFTFACVFNLNRVIPSCTNY